jgi:hypothetical protein
MFALGTSASRPDSTVQDSAMSSLIYVTAT